MTFEEYKEAIKKTPVTEEERGLLLRFEDAMRNVDRSLYRNGKDPLVGKMGDYVKTMGFIIKNSDKVPQNMWEQDVKKLDGFHNFLLAEDNFRTLMQAGTDGTEPAFGKDGKLFFDMLAILQKKIGIAIDPNEWKQYFDDMQKGLDWKKNAKAHPEPGQGEKQPEVAGKQAEKGEQPKAEEKKGEQPEAEEKKEEQPKAEEKKGEQPKAEEKAQDAPKAGDRQAEPLAEEPQEQVEEQPQAASGKKDLKARLTVYDIAQGQWTGGSILFGLLGDTLTAKEMGAIYKKMSIIKLLGQDPEEASAVYGEKYAELADDLNKRPEDVRERQEGPKQEIHKKSGLYDHYVDDRMDGPLKIFHEGMLELGAAMEKKARTAHFASPAEQNYFLLMKGFVDDINNGTFTQKILENPAYEYAYNMTCKMRNTAPNVNAREKEGKYVINVGFLQKIDDFRNVRLMQETGMVDAMAGGVKVTEMLEDHVAGGDVGREELIAEYRLQQKRMEKALSISGEKFDELQKQKVFDNSYDEFTADGARGFGYAQADAGARAEFLEAGYPASDLAAVSPFIRTVARLTRSNNAEQKKLEKDLAKYDVDLQKLEADQKNLPENASPQQVKELEDRRAKLDREKKELDQRRATLDQKLETQKMLEDAWKKVTDTSGHLTPQERTEKLQELRDSAVLIGERIGRGDRDMLDVAAQQMTQRLGAGLTLSEQALMADTADAFYRIIDDRNVDPRLMRSSGQFKKFKEELKKLSEMEQDMDPTDEEEIRQYQEQAARVVQTGNEYLRYKTKQMNGPSHDRSKTEALRVSVVDGIVSSLKTARLPGTDTPVLGDGAKILGVSVPETGDRILDTQQKDNLPVDYDSYIRLHTGRGAANGTREEMIEDLSKVMAAYMLKTAKEPVKFDLNHIHKCAEQLKEKFELNKLKQEALSRYLGSQGNVKNVIREIRGKVYGFKDGVTYEKYLDQMRDLYRQMADPAKDKRYAGDEAYKKLYEQVEKVAHLPENLDGIDQERLMEIIEGANFEILRAAQKCAVAHALDDGNRKNLNGPAGEAMDSLSVMSDLVEAGSARFKATLKKVNEARGTLSFEDEYLSVKYGGMAKIEPEDYGNRHFGRELRKLDENKLKTMKEIVQKNLNERLQGALGDAKEAVNAAEQKTLKGAAADAKEALKAARKTQEAPEPTKRPTLDGTGKKVDGKKPEPKKDAEKKEAEKKETEKKAAEKQENKIKRSNTLGR